MAKNSFFLSLKPALLSLGFAFSDDQEAALAAAADPEETILRALELFHEDRKSFRILLRWMIDFAPLIHVERLWSKSKAANPSVLPILGAICQKVVNQGDRRFKLIATRVASLMKTDPEKFKLPSVPEGSADPYLISKYGEDQEFKQFGIIVAGIEPEDSKKLLSTKEILRKNSWLRLRALIGPNFRADLVQLIAAKQVQKPSQAAKLLGCSRETAYRLWREVTLYDGVEKLAS